MRVTKFLEDLIIETEDDQEPKPDIAICSMCGWEEPVSECEEDEEGDWEYGYYKIHLCPKCEDGGCIDDYTRSSDNARESNEWFNRKHKNKKKDGFYE